MRVRKAGVVTVHDPQAQEKQRLIELAYRIAEVAELEQAGEDGLLLWDESVIEKPESIA